MIMFSTRLVQARQSSIWAPHPRASLCAARAPSRDLIPFLSTMDSISSTRITRRCRHWHGLLSKTCLSGPNFDTYPDTEVCVDIEFGGVVDPGAPSSVPNLAEMSKAVSSEGLNKVPVFVCMSVSMAPAFNMLSAVDGVLVENMLNRSTSPPRSESIGGTKSVHVSWSRDISASSIMVASKDGVFGSDVATSWPDLVDLGVVVPHSPFVWLKGDDPLDGVLRFSTVVSEGLLGRFRV